MPRTTSALPICCASAASFVGLFRRAVVGHAPTRVDREERIAEGAQQVVGDAAHVVALREEVVHTGEGTRDVFGGHRLEHGESQVERGTTERSLHRGRVERAAADRERLVEERERVASRSAGPPYNEVEHLRVGGDTFAAEDVDQVIAQLIGREQRELEVLGTRPDRREHLVRVGGREHEHDVGRRLLERLQERVRRSVVSMWTSSMT